jgi:crotonobetainyl-CoA:carnitine CoA-transferase CaiB-like acyl-CoA transferase
MPDQPLPLSGVRVIDLADELGPLCGRVLGDLGADVIRVEPPAGAASRALPPFAPDGTSLWFAYRNGNKRGATADLTTDAGRARLLGLLADADVLIESGRPGDLAAVGLAPDALTRRFPRLVVCSITPFGQTGPYAGYAATDDVVVALSGWLATSGIPSKPPLLVPGSLASDAAAVHALFAVLAALVQRGRTERGQYLDVSALEAVTQLNTWGIPNTSALINAGMAKPVVRSGDAALYPLIRTKDGRIRLVMLAARQWKAMWHWMGEPDAFADPMWEQTFTRLQNTDVLNPVFEAFFSALDMEDAAAEAQRRGIVATPMLKPGDVLANDHFASRGTFATTDVAPGITAPVATGFFEFDGARIGYRRRSPARGEHDAELSGPDVPSAADADAGAAPRGRPLEGLRVLDFGHGGVGVEGGRMLVEYGADVIKIETSTYPDFMRIVLGGNMTPSFASSSRSKRSFGVNAKHPEGLRILHELVARADIVIENNSTGTMDDMGLGYDALRACNPDVVMASSQLVGSRGTCASWIGYGPTIQPFGGMTYLWAFPDGDGPPGNPAIHPDHLAGRLCAIGALAGVLGRARRGGGAHVEIAQVEGVICTLGDLLLAEALAPGSVQPEGNDDPRGAPWGVFRCAGEERWAVVCVRDDADWQGLVRAMGAPAGHERFADAKVRAADPAAVNAFVEAWTTGLEPAAVMARAQAEGVPAGAMLSTLDQMHDAQLEARGFLVPVDQPGSGPLVFDGPAFRASGMEPARIEAAPRLGEHTRAVCREVLGLDEAEIDRLLQIGALEQAPPEPTG